MYRLSFTAAAFRLIESIRVAEAYQSLGDWKAVRASVFSDDLLQKGKRSTISSEFREIALRLGNLSDREIQFLVQTDTVSQRHLLLIAICRTYGFVRQFVLDVVRVNYQRFEFDITETDYRRFFDHQAAVHDELDRLSDSSKAKIKQVLFKMLEGAGYITSVRQRTITRPVVLDTLAELIRQSRPADLPLIVFNDRDL